MNNSRKKLNLQANIADPDTFYAELIALQPNLSADEDSQCLYNN